MSSEATRASVDAGGNAPSAMPAAPPASHRRRGNPVLPARRFGLRQGTFDFSRAVRTAPFWRFEERHAVLLYVVFSPTFLRPSPARRRHSEHPGHVVAPFGDTTSPARAPHLARLAGHFPAGLAVCLSRSRGPPTFLRSTSWQRHHRLGPPSIGTATRSFAVSPNSSFPPAFPAMIADYCISARPNGFYFIFHPLSFPNFPAPLQSVGVRLDA